MFEQIKLEAAMAVLAVSIGLAFAGGWAVNGWRLGAALEHAGRERDQALAQGKVLAAATAACSQSVAEGAAASRQALQQGRALLDQAKRIGAPAEAQAARLEELLRRPPPAGAGCEDAWKEIEKAGAP